MNYRQLIKKARIAAGLTQGELAERSGVNGRGTINAIENGFQECSVSQLEAISKAVKKPPCELMNGYKHK